MILLHEPYLPILAANHLQACLESGWVSSAGPWVQDFEQGIAAYTQSPYAVATQSGTAALHVAMQLVGVNKGDYVLMPALGFVALPNAASYLGAAPIFIDVHPQTWQLDVDLLRDFLAEQTTVKQGQCFFQADGRRIAAISLVHVLGYVFDPTSLLELAAAYHLPVVEDAAEAMGSWWAAQHAGTWGQVGVLSFNGNKTLTTGGGGMILTKEAALAQQALHLTTQAKSDPQFYIHDTIGFNYRMTSLAATLGLAQLEHLPEILDKKRWIHRRYVEAFSPSEQIQGFLPALPPMKPNHWLNTIALTDRSLRDQALAALATARIQARPLWHPLPALQPYQHFPFIHRQNPSLTHQIVDCSVSLPSSPALAESDQQRVIEVMQSIL